MLLEHSGKESCAPVRNLKAINGQLGEKALTPKEAGEILQLHPKTVIRFAERREIPGRKFGNRWRFKRSALDAVLNGDIRLGRRP